MAAINLTDAKIKGLKPPAKGQAEIADAIVPSLRVRIGKSGKRSFVVRKRGKDKVHTVTLGAYHERRFSLADARKRAREVIEQIDMRGTYEPDIGLQGDTEDDLFRDALDSYMKRHVHKKGLRSAGEIERTFQTYVLPDWGHRPIHSITRKDVATLLDKIEDGEAGEGGNMGGPVMADRTLAQVRALFTWYALRDDEFISPIVRGMARTAPSERRSTRALADEELRLFWTATGQEQPLGDFLRLCLLTSQRRGKVEAMRWDDIKDGVWTVATQKREKANAEVIKLPPMALAIINAQPKVKGNPHVFAGKGDTHFHAGDKFKKRLDARIANLNGGKAIPAWRVHDLRHTAKTLMRRAKVGAVISERVLGHSIKGIEGTYDHHDYVDEIAEALLQLERVIADILDTDGRVVPLRGTAA